MGQVHPRAKGIVGRRLAQAAFATVYGGQVPAQGPVLSGCSVAGATLTITLNTSMGEAATWAEGTSVAAENTALYVLAAPNALPDNAADNHHGPSWQDYGGPYASGHELGVAGWIPVDARVAGDGRSLTVDLGALKGAAPTAVRYATGTGGWGAPFLTRMCCGPTVDAGAEPCAPDSCPLRSAGEGHLPGVPFVARITAAGKCQCLAPATCDA
jgi:hypothetical protein